MYKTLQHPSDPDEKRVADHLKKIQALAVQREAIKIKHLRSVKDSLTEKQTLAFFNKLAAYRNKRFLEITQGVK